MTKRNEKLLVDGRIWGMSDSLRKSTHFNFVVDDIYNEFCHELKKAKGVGYYESDYFQIFTGNWKRVLKNKFPQIVQEIEKFYIDQYHIINQNYILCNYTNQNSQSMTATVHQTNSAKTTWKQLSFL